jgi:DNA-binding winged helix-turn-helix (wHTH) protein/TolB-like protein
MRFGRFEFDPEEGALSREGVPVKLQQQPARVLALLAERAGQVVTRDELRQRIWGTGTFVDFERGLNFCISQIRSALGDSAGTPQYIETIPRRGYRFIAAIEPEPPVTDRSPGPGRAARPWLAPLIAAAVLVAGAVVLVAGRPWGGSRAPDVFRVAVAPFDNETGNPALDRVAVGVSDAAVARLAVPELVPRIAVVGNAAILRTPRASRDLKAIGTSLGVEYVVLGQLKRDAERVRLIAHLIRTRDEVHLWANTFDRPSFGLDVQAELAERIAQSVAAQLTAR